MFKYLFQKYVCRVDIKRLYRLREKQVNSGVDSEAPIIYI